MNYSIETIRLFFLNLIFIIWNKLKIMVLITVTKMTLFSSFHYCFRDLTFQRTGIIWSVKEDTLMRINTQDNIEI